MEIVVSLIIPTYNRGSLIPHTIESILKQSYEKWELIIVDDGSSDDTEALVKKISDVDPRVQFFKRPLDRKKGANSCRNLGFELAKGKYIKWVDSDDLLDKYILETQLDVFIANPELDLVVCNGAFFTDEKGVSNILWANELISNNIVFDSLRNNVRWHVCGCLWKKSFFKESPYKEGLQNSQEWLMHMTALLKKPVIRSINQTLFYVRRSSYGRISNNLTSTYYQNEAKARLIFLNKYLSSSLAPKKAIIVYEAVKQIGIALFYSIKRFPSKQ